MSTNGADDSDLERMVDRADLDELVRGIDALCATREWDRLFRLRTLTRSAIQTGRQVWPATTLAEYRLALLAPAEWASRVLHEDASRFGIGPLTEVIAQNHTWPELADHLEHGPQREFVAHERSMRGDVVTEIGVETRVLDIPWTLQDWEPDYSFPVYGDSGVTHPNPADGWQHTWQPITVSTADPGLVLDDDATEDALRRLVDPWTSFSGGRARAIVVEGSETDALAHLASGDVEITPLEPHQVLQWLVWCGASGGAHGRRRGMASGRFGTWWLLGALGGFIEDWDELERHGELGDAVGETLATFTWNRWRTMQRHGYDLSVVAHATEEGVSVVLSAHDDADTTPSSTSPTL